MRPKLRFLLAVGAVVLTLTGAPSAGGASTAAGPPAEAALGNLAQVQSGYELSCARTKGGQVRCWGSNESGQLGNGNTNPHQFAVPVRSVSGPGNLTGVTQIAVGDTHACALLTNRQVRCWGENFHGQLGNGDPGGVDRSRPVAVRNAANTGNLTNVKAITAETAGTCALLRNNQVRCWGEDFGGQLGDGAPNANSPLPVTVLNVAGTGPLRTVRSIDGGDDNNCAVLANGQARCWGANGGGQLGDDSTTPSPLPVVVVNAAGTSPLTGVTQISAGGYDTCARLANGRVRCWGTNEYGEVGDGTDVERHRPTLVKNAGGTGPLLGVARVSAGAYHTCALLTSGQARCWGETRYGGLGDGSPVGNAGGRFLPRPVKINATTRLTGVVQLHGNSYTTCAVVRSGSARCWGANDYFAVGDGTDVDRNFATLVRV